MTDFLWSWYHTDPFWYALLGCVLICMYILLRHNLERFDDVERPVAQCVLAVVLTFGTSLLAYTWTIHFWGLLGLAVLSVFLLGCLLGFLAEELDAKEWVIDAFLIAIAVVFMVGVASAIRYAGDYDWAGFWQYLNSPE